MDRNEYLIIELARDNVALRQVTKHLEGEISQLNATLDSVRDSYFSVRPILGLDLSPEEKIKKIQEIYE